MRIILESEFYLLSSFLPKILPTFVCLKMGKAHLYLAKNLNITKMLQNLIKM